MTQTEKTEWLAKEVMGWVKVAATKDMSSLEDYGRYTIEDNAVVVRTVDGSIHYCWNPYERIQDAWMLVGRVLQNTTPLECEEWRSRINPPNPAGLFLVWWLRESDTLVGLTAPEFATAIADAVFAAAGGEK